MKITYYMIGLLLVAGCSHVDQYDTEVAKQQQTVEQARAEVDAELPKCTGGKKMITLPPKQYLKSVKCYTKLVEEKVVPVSPYPQPLQKFLYVNLENASLYSQGKISREQLEARGKMAALIMDEETSRMNNDARQQLANQDAAEQANLARALGGFQPQRPVYTTCSGYGRTVQCRSQ